VSSELFSVWYRSLLPDGSVWCESSDPDEVLDSETPGLTFQKKEVYKVSEGWVEWPA
jgi:hypothetical protein